MATDFTQVITSQHRDKPKFMAMCELLSTSLGQIVDATNKMVNDFDVDQAIGVQLDAIGKWVGISRNLLVPITDAWFTWNDSNLGWNRSNWKGPFESTQGITTLDDTTYRAVIKAKIGANYWDGSNEGLNIIGQEALTEINVRVFAIDNMDMSMTVYVLGTPTAAILELIRRGIIPPKPGGVRVAGYILGGAPGAPLFALDAPTTSLTAGLDFGAFGEEI